MKVIVGITLNDEKYLILHQEHQTHPWKSAPNDNLFVSCVCSTLLFLFMVEFYIYALSHKYLA